MHSGRHGDYLWELKNGELIILSLDARIGLLKTQSAGNRFNNAEQATWFAQGQIDQQLEALGELAAARLREGCS